MSRNNIDTFKLLFCEEIILSRFPDEGITRYACLTFALSDTLTGRVGVVIVFIEEPPTQNVIFTTVILDMFVRTVDDAAEIIAGEQFTRYYEMTNGFLANLEMHLSAGVQGASTEEEIVRNLRYLYVFICITLAYIATTATIVHEQHLRRNAALMTVFDGIIPPATNRNETIFTEEEVVRHLGFNSVFTGIQVENIIPSQP